MIIFEKLRYQNFLSTGNQFIEIILNKSKSTLLVGKNGAGKSSVCEALIYGLYGRPYRNINKPQLVNSITNKNMLVEVEFRIGDKHYLVRRGMKPNIFEIYLNGVMINQNADVREYQDMFEKTILKMNYKSACQIVVLGSSNHIPFMQLTPSDRRHVIEDLLDIQIFSTMNNLLKERISKNKSDIREADYQIDLIEQKIDMHKKHISSLQSNNDDLIKTKQSLIDDIHLKISDSNTEIKILKMSIDSLQLLIADSSDVQNKKKKLLDLETKLEEKIRTLKKDIMFFEKHDNCPTCKQGIDQVFKDKRVEDRKSSLSDVEEALIKIEKEIVDINEKMIYISKINAQISTLENEIIAYSNDIRSWKSSVETLQREIESIGKNTNQIDKTSSDIDSLDKELKSQTKIKYDLIAHKEILDVSAVLLKDSGIKTRIIKQYVPIINKLMNKYLAAFDFMVNFELNEKFEETIKSRYRDIFTYASFSEGEKFRIDIALTLTWRALAKMRNSAATNLLIMDEIFDGSSDQMGIDSFLEILDTMDKNTNTFVISHRGDVLQDKFHSSIHFEKHKNFSRIVQ